MCNWGNAAVLCQESYQYYVVVVLVVAMLVVSVMGVVIGGTCDAVVGLRECDDG